MTYCHVDNQIRNHAHEMGQEADPEIVVNERIENVLMNPELEHEIIEEVIEAMECLDGAEVNYRAVTEARGERSLEEAFGNDFGLFMEHLYTVVENRS